MRKRATHLRRTVAVTFLLLVATPAAVAQEEYAAETGELGDVETLIFVSFSGDGFAVESTVLLTLTSVETEEEFDLGTIVADVEGAIRGPVPLPPDLAPGVYVLTAIGATPDGATRTLGTEIVIPGAPDTESTGASTTTTSEATTTSLGSTATTLPEVATDALLAALEAVSRVAG